MGRGRKKRETKMSAGRQRDRVRSKMRRRVGGNEIREEWRASGEGERLGIGRRQ